MKPQRNLLIVGAGYFGLTLGAAAKASNWHVIAARRDIKEIKRHHDFDWLRLDVAQRDDLRETMLELKSRHRLDAVVYCVSAGSPDDHAYRLAYHDGLRNILDHIAPETRLLFVSSTGVYPEDDGQWVDESAPIDPETLAPSRQELFAGERLVQSRPNSVVTRFSGIYGPGRTRMISVARSLPNPLIIRNRDYTNRIHVEDGARAVAHLLELQRPENLYCVTDHDPAPQHEVLLWLREQMSLQKPNVQFESRGSIVSTADELQATNKRISNTRLLDAGFQFKYPTFREGYSPLLTTAT